MKVSLTDLGGPKGQGTGAYSPTAMGMITDHATVPHGTVTFKVKNIGAVDHEMLILPLADAQPIGSRPFRGDGRIDDSGKLHDESGMSHDGSGAHDESGKPHDGSHAVPNALVTVTMTLSPGRYELVCNHPGHYISGMFNQLTVT